RNGGGTLLVGTFSRGLFLYDGSSFRPWRVPASDFLRLRTPYKAVELPNRDLAVATLSDGVVILTREGQVVQHLQSESGLPSTGVTSIGVDNQGGLWMGPENGICRTEIPSPLTIVDAATGLQDQPIDLMRHNGVLYVATTRG